MKRNIFFKCLGVIGLCPLVLTKKKEELEFFMEAGESYLIHEPFINGGTSLKNGHTRRTICTWGYNHERNVGYYTVYLKNGKEITFTTNIYDTKLWSEKYDYLAYINV